MCFSATANFVGSAILGGIGIATLAQVKHRRELLFASVPLLFAFHQFTEGLVWLGLDGKLPATVAHNAGAAFMLYAQALLPILLPLGVFLFEPTATRRRKMIPFLVLGMCLCLYVLWGLAAFQTQVFVERNSIVYLNSATHHGLVASLYVVATCGSLFFSKVKDMVIFGAANLTIVLATMAVKEYAFTSVWCAYAAIASIILWFGFHHSSQSRPFQYS